jgi:predicted dehydrogenase
MLRFGILGAARIAPLALIQPATLLPEVSVTAVAASSAEKAQAFADEHDIPGISASYAELIDSPDIDAIYNALPPNLHERWSIAALHAGKHVLCEKPFAMNAAQARRMVATADASHRLLLEAFHYRFHPYFHRVLEFLADDAIGDIRHIEAQFDVRIPYSLSEFRHDPMLGGGALMDLGCYPVHWVRLLIGSEPTVTQAECERSDSGVDVATRASLRFANGATAEVMTAMHETARERHYAHVVIEGERGRLTLENPIAPHNGNKIIVEGDEASYDATISGDSTYFYQLAHFVAAVEGSETPLTGGEDAINNMQLIDAIYEAAGFERPAFD